MRDIRGWIRFAAGAAIALAGIAAGESAAGATRWRLVDIGTLGGPGSYAAAVSDGGFVVGCSDVMPSGVHAFIWRGGTIRDLGTGGGPATGNSCALAVNGTGTVAGRSSTGELVIWSGSSVVGLGVHGDIGGMNDAGVVVGSYLDGATRHAFLFRDATLTDLGTLGTGGATQPYSAAAAINARDEVVGTSNGRAFLYAGGTMRDLGTLGGKSGAAKGINDRGQVVGLSSNQRGQPLPFLYEGVMRTLPGGAYAAAIAINDRVQVVASGEGRHGYLVEDGRVTWLDSLPAVRAKGWHHLEPTGINVWGWIVGTAFNAEGDSRAFLLVPGN